MPYSATVKSMVRKLANKTDFKLGKQIGTGSAYGAVFQLKEKSRNKRVIKIFKTRTMSEGRKEIAVSVRMGREGVGPKIYLGGIVGYSQGRYTFYMVMSEISGDIYSMKVKCPSMYEKHKKSIKRQIKKLITIMHSRQFVHADLKDDNIGYLEVKNKPPRVYIIDFGFATLHDKQLKTNKNLAMAIVRAYREHGFSYKDMMAMNGFPSVQRRFLEELHRDLKIKKSKVAVDVEKIYKKTKNTNFKNLFINIEGGGPMRYQIADEHWIVFNPKEVFPNVVTSIAKNKLIRNEIIGSNGNITKKNGTFNGL